MDRSKAILADISNFLPLVESHIMNKNAELSDVVVVTSLKQCLDTLGKMLNQCENLGITEDINGVRKRINSAKETIEMLQCSDVHGTCDTEFGDAHILSNGCTKPVPKHSLYGQHLDMTNKEFDNLIEEWAEDSQAGSQNTIRKRGTSFCGSFQEGIRGELAQLADTMKSKALWYRDVLVRDNKALSKCTYEQEKQLDTVAHVSKEAYNLSKTGTLSLRQSIFMVVSMFAALIMMLFVFILT